MLRQELSGLPRTNEVRLPGHASPVITQPCTPVHTLSRYVFTGSNNTASYMRF